MVAEAASREEVLSQVGARDPDIVVLDAFLDTPTIIGLIHELKQRHPRCHPIVLNLQEDDSAALRILETGASGYLSKDHSLSQLIEAIQQVARGKLYVSPSLASRLITGLQASTIGPRHRALSNREYQVLSMYGAGIPFKHIAKAFGVSPKTVSTYRTRILSKLRLRSNVDMIRYAIEHHVAPSSNSSRSERRKSPTDLLGGV